MKVRFKKYFFSLTLILFINIFAFSNDFKKTRQKPLTMANTKCLQLSLRDYCLIIGMTWQRYTGRSRPPYRQSPSKLIIYISHIFVYVVLSYPNFTFSTADKSTKSFVNPFKLLFNELRTTVKLASAVRLYTRINALHQCVCKLLY